MHHATFLSPWRDAFGSQRHSRAALISASKLNGKLSRALRLLRALSLPACSWKWRRARQQMPWTGDPSLPPPWRERRPFHLILQPAALLLLPALCKSLLLVAANSRQLTSWTSAFTSGEILSE